ncbi:hypothetical protein IQ235_06065 [Oscillatoriales cyanobacterium LEGE 11467]|uniref:Uncharacterized protein n=1 Tax=Zarconia navalis LEGE 11467 TaxID=1828826 RepID=A0A928VUF3_9CYAN|nr:hypothetical protein [Zarconia navalis LEGE 11467]
MMAAVSSLEAETFIGSSPKVATRPTQSFVEDGNILAEFARDRAIV